MPSQYAKKRQLEGAWDIDLQRLDLERLFTDFGYYAEQVLKIYPKHEGGAIPLRLNTCQRLLCYGLPPGGQEDPRFSQARIGVGWVRKKQTGQPIREIILKFRQMGMSTLATAWAFYHAHTTYGHNAMIVAHDEDTTKHLFRMCQTYFTGLPRQLRPSVSNRTSAEIVFSEQQGDGGLGSGIYTATAGHTESGHGRTIHTLILSEVSRWRDFERVIVGLLETVPSSAETSPGTTVIMESVANVAGDYFHHLYEEAKQGRGGMEPIFLPWYLMDEYRLTCPEDFEFPDHIVEMAKEYPWVTRDQWYWYTKKWETQEIAHPGRGDRFMRMLYPSNESEAFIAQGFCAFPESGILYFQPRVKDPPMYGEVIGGSVIRQPYGRLRIWELPQPGTLYVLGADPASGSGRAASAIEVIAYPGYRQVAEWGDTEIDPKAFAHVIKAIGMFYNDALCIVEINNVGLITNTELDDIYPSGNIYEQEFFNTRGGVRRSKHTGWVTTLDSKRLLVGQANALLAASPPLCVIRSPLLLSQMKNMVTLLEGDERYYHRDSGDYCMAWLLAIMACWRKIARLDQAAQDYENPNRVRREEAVVDHSIFRDNWTPGEETSDPHWMDL